MPAPIVYDVVASLGRTTDHLGEAFTRLGRRLDQSLMAPELYTVHEESPDQDPFIQAHVASEHLYDAHLFTQKAAKSLQYARTAIAGQKYTTTGHKSAEDDEPR
jgi:hypothetical protein